MSSEQTSRTSRRAAVVSVVLVAQHAVGLHTTLAHVTEPAPPAPIFPIVRVLGLSSGYCSVATDGVVAVVDIPDGSTTRQVVQQRFTLPESSGWFVSPVVELGDATWGLGLRYIFANYEGLGRSELRDAEPEDVRADFVKHDFDFSIRRTSELPWGVRVSFYTGMRLEIQEAERTTSRTLPAPPRTDNFDFNIFAVPLGATAQYVIPNTSGAVFLSGTFFPYTRVASGSAPEVDDFGTSYAVEGGVLYDLAGWLGFALAPRLSVRRQTIRAGWFEETVDQLVVGLVAPF